MADVPAAHLEFLAEQRRRRERVAAAARLTGDKYLTCARCGWQEAESICQMNGIRACPKCGARECRVTCLPYNPNPGRSVPGANPQGR